MLVPNQRPGKYNSTRPSVMSLTLKVIYYQYTYLLQFHINSIHVHYICTWPSVIVCNNCIRPFAMSFTVAPNQHSFLFNLRLQARISDTLAQTCIHICYSNIQLSVLSVALVPDQYSSNDCYNCTRPTALYFTVTPKQQPIWLRTSTTCRYLTQFFVCVDTLHCIK